MCRQPGVGCNEPEYSPTGILHGVGRRAPSLGLTLQKKGAIFNTFPFMVIV